MSSSAEWERGGRRKERRDKEEAKIKQLEGMARSLASLFPTDL